MLRELEQKIRHAAISRGWKKPNTMREHAGLLSPVRLEIANHIEWRLRPIDAMVVKGRRPALWALMPNLEPAILFGGYIAFLEFLTHARPFLAQRGIDLKIIVTTARFDAEKFVSDPASRKYATALKGVDILSLKDIARISISPDDHFIGYSAWEAYSAAQLAARVGTRPIQFIQEHEAIFHEYCAVRAVVEGGFEQGCFPIFNGAMLKQHFESNKIGPFRSGSLQPEDFFVFEHAIEAVSPDWSPRKTKTMMIYARPEGHAGRNLYELIEIALKRLCWGGHFGDEWRFLGVGALGEIPARELGGGHQLKFVPKLPRDQYSALVSSVDVGISMMYAPHPSVVPYEMAASGAIVVTNTFANRPKSYFENLSKNIVACEPRLEDIEAAIRQAAVMARDVPARKRNVYLPKNRCWDDVFGESSLQTLFDRVMIH
jgi:hypothetical protein